MVSTYTTDMLFTRVRSNRYIWEMPVYVDGVMTTNVTYVHNHRLVRNILGAGAIPQATVHACQYEAVADKPTAPQVDREDLSLGLALADRSCPLHSFLATVNAKWRFWRSGDRPIPLLSF